jgi:molecular chaperone DnaK
MGAAVQGGLIAGVDVGAVLVDITPHTIGVEAVGMLNGVTSVYKNVPVIQRNTPLPARRTEIFTTVADGQEGANIRIFQGENEDTRYNTLIGSFKIEGLADVHAGNQIVVRLDLDLNGILNVTATERLTGLSRKVTIDNAMERFKANHRVDAVDRLEAMFDNASSDSNALAIRQDSDLDEFESSDDATEETAIVASARELMASAERMLASANAEDAAELTAMLADLRRAVDAKAEDDIGRIVAEVEDLVFYLKEN